MPKKDGKKNQPREKTPRTPTQKRIMYCCLLGAVCVLGAAFTGKWRKSEIDPVINQSGRAWQDRHYGLSSVQSSSSAFVSWDKVEQSVCLKAKLYSGSGSGLEKQAKMAAGALAGSASSLGCAAWPSCVQHTQLRCEKYKAHVMWNQGVFGLLGLGAAAALLGAGLVYTEEESKKAEDQECALRRTSLGLTGSAAAAVLGPAVYAVQSDMMLKALAANAHYPYAPLHVSFYAAVVGAVSLCLAAAFATQRYWAFQNSQNEQQWEDASLAANAGFSGAPAWGPPPLMGPPPMPGVAGFGGAMPMVH
jgi:hypothetical protein